MDHSIIDPRGRLRRSSYVPTFVVVNLASVGVRDIPFEGMAGQFAFVAATLFVAWCVFCTMSKRLHDAGRSALLAAVNVALVSFSGIMADVGGVGASTTASAAALVCAMLIGLYVLVAPPSPSASRHGPDPRSGRATEPEADPKPRPDEAAAA